MEEVCTGCLCTGRKLQYIGDTGFHQHYSQILNEISVQEVSQICIRICWECCALLHKFQKFKAKVQQSYTDLLWNVPPTCNHPHLTTTPVINLSYPEQNSNSIKVEDNLAEDIKTEAEDESTEHKEPATFVNDLAVERDVEEPTKKSKKKPKEKKPSKNKIKVKKKKKTTKVPPKPKKEELSQPNEVFQPSADIEPLSEGISDTELPTDAAEVSYQEDDDKPLAMKIDVEETKVVFKEDVTNLPSEVLKSSNQPLPKAPIELLPEKPVCAECGKTFSSRKTYRYHINVLHKGNNHYPCPRCGKIYQWKSNLGRHMRTHKAVDAGELYCELCDKSFASVATYRQHLRISRRHVSENEFSFTCDECGKKFVNKTRLRDHIDWEHLKKIKFRCQLCNKPFKCHTSLYVHLQNVHRNKEKKDNLCHVCGKSYQNAAKLKYHIIALHTGETPYQCSQCSAAFGWYSSLYRHIREVHYKVKAQPKKTKRAKKIDIEPPPYMNYHP